jgi:hypothetical protein
MSEIRNNIKFNICPPATCPKPTVNTTATDVQTTSAKVTFTENGMATAWEYYIGATPDDLSAVAVTGETGTNPYTFTVSGLTAGTEYKVWVRAVCGVGDKSDWSFTASTFTTSLCEVSEKIAYTIVSTDSYGDGWNGARLIIKQNGIVVATIINEDLDGFDFSDGNEYENEENTHTVLLCPCMPFTVDWVYGAYDSEASFVVYDNLVVEIKNVPDASSLTAGEIYSGTVNCPVACEEPVITLSPDLTSIAAGDVSVEAYIQHIIVTSENLLSNITVSAADEVNGYILFGTNEDAMVAITPSQATGSGYDLQMSVSSTGGGAGSGKVVLTYKDCSDNDQTIEISVTWTAQWPTGIDEQIANARVYPTFSTGTVKVAAPMGTVIKVADISGRVLDSYTVNSDIQTIDLNYASGTYFVILQNGNENAVHKVILNRYLRN